MDERPARTTTEDRFDLGTGSLRSHTARGSIVNGVYTVGLSSLTLLKGFLVAAALTRVEYGVWGIVVITLAGVSWLKQAGVGDKYIQQSEGDQELAFQKAFTLEMIVAAAACVLMIAAAPLLALAYGEWQIVPPMLVLALVFISGGLTAPLWVYYRRMDFLRQRLLQAVDPIVAFVVTVGLALAGVGYWSLVVGVVAGAFAGAAVALAASPYELRFRYDPGTMREYASYSWPLLISGASAIVMAQGAIFFGEAELGLAGAGAITLGATIVNYADRIDQIITFTLYPAICAVADRTELLFESFVKSNRLAIMWGLPFGLGMALFGPDLVEFGIGEEWHPAVLLIQLFGVSCAFNQIGFNWTAFFRARNETRPMAIVGVITMLAFVAIALPLLHSDGLDGLAWGMLGVTAVTLAARTFFLTRLFSGFQLLRHSVRAVAPSLPAMLAVIAVRQLESGERTLGLALGELALYAFVTVAATLVFERELLRELRTYLQALPDPQPGVAGSA